METDDAVAAAVNLQRDAGLMSSNLQILCQFVTSLQRMSSEVLSLALGQVVFPLDCLFQGGGICRRWVLVQGCVLRLVRVFSGLPPWAGCFR